ISGLFFFQAEDGIRDFHVTGVQTCALPISFITGQVFARFDGSRAFYLLLLPMALLLATLALLDRSARRQRPLPAAVATREGHARSEERRVGKEGRAASATEHRVASSTQMLE